MKRVLSLVLVAVMVLSIFAGLQISSSALEPTGGCGDNVYWSFDSETGTLTISGEGDMYDYHSGYYTESPFYAQSNIKNVIINNGVTSVCSSAFYSCGSLESVVISDTVTEIGNHSFAKCGALKEVKLSDSITRINGSVFSDCTNLEEIIIPGSVKQIGENAFFGCSKLKNIIIPESATSIENLAFSECRSISSIIIPKSVTYVGMAVFDLCDNLTIIKVDENNSVYDSRDNCNAIIESKSNKIICACNTTVIPNTVTSIAQGVFSNINLTSIKIPTSVTFIDFCAFNNCVNLKDVYYQGSMEQWKAIKIEASNDCLTSATIHYNEAAHVHAYKKLVVAPKANALGYTCYKCSCGQYKKDSKGIVKTAFKAPTGKPSGFKCASRTATAEKFTWTKTSGASGYQVQISNAKGNAWGTSKVLTANSYTFSKLTAGSAYKARVRFYIKAADGKNYYGAWTTINSPTLPAGTSITKVTGAKKAFTAQWKKAAVTGYQLQYAANNKFSGAKTVTIKKAGTLKYTVSKLAASKTFYVRVRTYKAISGANYYSTWSAVKAVKTK